MSDLDPRVAMALDRITRSATHLLTAVYEAADANNDDVGLDTFSLILILDQRDDLDEGATEHCVSVCESKRLYVQEGILRAALREHDIKMRGQQYDETDDDD